MVVWRSAAPSHAAGMHLATRTHKKHLSNSSRAIRLANEGEFHKAALALKCHGLA